MIPPHLSHQTYVSLFQQNYCTLRKCGRLSEYTDSAQTEVFDHSSRYVNVSDEYDQNWLDRMKLVCNRTIPITLPSGKNILADTMFKSQYRAHQPWHESSTSMSRYPSYHHPNLGTGKRYLRVYIHLRFRHARSRAQPLAWPVTLSVAGIPIKGYSSFIDCKAWRHDCESVKNNVFFLGL